MVVVASGVALSGDTYELSGTGLGSANNPAPTQRLRRNDSVVLDAGKTSNPDFIPFTPWVAIDPTIMVAIQRSNGTLSTYAGREDGDPSVYSRFNPYARLNELIGKMPSLAELMPSFFTQSDRVYLSGRIIQDNTETPQWIKDYSGTTNGFNVWPISVYSSDALDPTKDVLTPRLDMQNAAWAILTPAPGTRNKFMEYFNEYSPPAIGGTSMITLEHVIFYGGYSTGDGGALSLYRSNGKGIANETVRGTVQIKGNVAFVANIARNKGGAILGEESIQFDGNAYFVGNMAGAQYNTQQGGIFMFNIAGGSSYDGSGGAMRVGTGGQNLIFNRDAIFIGNMASAEGGAITVHNGSTVRFNGRTIFMGNIAGLYPQATSSRGGGNGGAYTYGADNNKTVFNGESYFVANQSSGYGGAIAEAYSDNKGNNSYFDFYAPALFTDNVSGFRPDWELIYSSMDADASFVPPVNITSGTGVMSEKLEEGVPVNIWYGETTTGVFSGTNTVTGLSDYGAKVRGGGAIHTYGSYLVFREGAPAAFLRNSTNGNGGALDIMLNNNNASNPMQYFGAMFFADATFTGNAADVNGGAIQAGHYGAARSDTWVWDKASMTSTALYFGKAGAGSMLTMHGNIAYSKDPVKAGDGVRVNDVPLWGGGAAFATGGFYVESLYSFWHNQAKGSGGALLIGSGAPPATVQTRYGTPWSLVLNPLDWKPAGTYSTAGDWGLLKDNVAMKDGGAIGSYDGAKLLIGSGAKFIDNYAGGEGGAIAIGLVSTATHASILSNAPQLNLNARVADILFKGNRAGVTIYETGTVTVTGSDGLPVDEVVDLVDFNKILDPTRTNDGGISADGYLRLDPHSGRANDIYVGAGAVTGLSPIAGVINLDAYAGMQIYMDGGIEMDHTGKNLLVNINTIQDSARMTYSTTTTGTTADANGTTVTSSTNGTTVVETTVTVASGTKTTVVRTTSDRVSIGDAATAPQILANTTPTGLVWLENASADIEGVTTVGHGTLRISGTGSDLHWGSAANVSQAGTLFDLKGPATLEANATINAETITIGDGATLRVLGGGALTLNAGTGGVTLGAAAGLHLAGNGRLNLGLTTLASGQIVSISVGDVITSHTAAQTLTLAKDATTLADITLNNAALAVGLFAGSTSDKIVADDITLSGSTDISLTSLAQGAFVIADAAGALNDTASYWFDYKGTDLGSFGTRLTIGASAMGNDLTLNYSTSNLVLDWNDAGGSNSWTSVSGNMTNGDSDYVLGDVVRFAGAGETVSVDENVGVAGMTVDGNYTFAGAHGITTEADAWGGSAEAAADGRLTMSGTGKILTLANATGLGQRNEFTGGILITGGTVAAGTAAQLGAALSKIEFANTTDNGAALLVTGQMVLDGAQSLDSQRLDVAAGNIATLATSDASQLAVLNNATGADAGGVFHVDAGATLNLKADGDMLFLNNTSGAGGGALALEAGAEVNVDVADGRTVMFGLQGDRALRTAANISAADSISGAADSVINKNGAGILSINSDSSDFAGTLNVNTGATLLGEGSVFGSAASKVNVGAGALLGGAATIGGDLAVNGGRLSIDGGATFGRMAATANDYGAQTLTIAGDLNLNSATLIYNAVLSKSNEYSTDVVSVGGAADLTGITTLDFNRMGNGITTLIQTASTGYISLSGNTSSVDSGTLSIGNSGTTLVSDRFVTATDFVITKGGIAVDETRYQTQVGYELAGSAIIVTGSKIDDTTGDWITVTSTLTYAKDASGKFTETITGTVTGTNPSLTRNMDAFPSSLGDLSSILGEGLTLVSQTNFYDTTKLQLDSTVVNARLYWTGESGAAWNTMLENWHIPVASDKTFADGDSVVFGAKNDSGNLYDAGNEANRNIAVDLSGVWVADMTFTGTSNWTIRGGKITTNAGANNYKDSDGRDLSTGQFLLDANFTGTVFLANESINFNGIFVTDEAGVTAKSPDVAIKNGTLEATALGLGENLIQNDSLLVFNQIRNDTFKGRVSGTGNVIQIQTGSAGGVILNDTGFVAASNYDLQSGQLQVSSSTGLTVADTLLVRPGAQLLVTSHLVAGTLVNNGLLARTPVIGDAQKPPSELRDSEHNRDPGVGDTSIYVQGNYQSDGGVLLLHTYRDGALVNNVTVSGNSSGTTHVILRNVASLDTASSVTNVVGTGTYFRPDGRADSINPIISPKRDSLIFATSGGSRNLKLVMDDNDWDQSILPTATIGSIVPFATVTTGTYDVITTTTVTTVMVSGTIVSSSSASTTTRSGTLSTATKNDHLFNLDGSIASLVASSTRILGISGTVTTSGTVETSGTLVITDVIDVASTAFITDSSITYGQSEIDYSESRDNYKLVQGKNGNWYFRNINVGIQDVDLPMIGAAPAVADMVGWNGIKAVHQHINARHDALEKGWNLWSNLTHTTERVRKEYYNGTRIKQEHIQVGADYAFAKDEVGKFSRVPSISVGGAYSLTAIRAERPDQSSLEANVSAFTGYASARWWRLYLDALVEYSPDTKYKAEIDGNVPFDLDGTVKGSRTGASAELGVIITPEGLGQLEIYTSAGMQKHDFSSVSSIAEPAHLTTTDGYNPIYDPASSNGRRYHFDAPSTTKIELGFRWGSHLELNETWAFRPWGGAATGRVSGNDYLIWVDDHNVNNDMNGSYFTVQGGVAAIFRRNLQLYLTYGFTGGKATNNYSLATGVNYHW
ncbi:hypothetical protein AW736_14925 [Termitidicoccus mucosus]|uniref:Autotransporter domain-containing protein n=1 Tax=Termitidicoccus mucosus TaxID=1184151 RepID=A0A178IGD8_9BACT|nr:hypothetical protein AW736_14925 [Opitutaceae bacterium TSB47]